MFRGCSRRFEVNRRSKLPTANFQLIAAHLLCRAVQAGTDFRKGESSELIGVSSSNIACFIEGTVCYDAMVLERQVGDARKLLQAKQPRGPQYERTAGIGFT
jgi:hypothetical protein